MRRLLQTSFVLAVLGASALIPGGLATPSSASAQVYGAVDSGNVNRPGSVYFQLGRSAYGVPRDRDYKTYDNQHAPLSLRSAYGVPRVLDYAPYNYNSGYGQGAYLPGYGRFSGRSGWGEYSKYRIPGTPR